MKKAPNRDGWKLFYSSLRSEHSSSFTTNFERKNGITLLNLESPWSRPARSRSVRTVCGDGLQ